MNIYIQYMVSLRCRLIVKSSLIDLKIPFVSVEQGLVKLSEPLPKDKLAKLKSVLHHSGLDILDDSKSVLIDEMENHINDMILSVDKTHYNSYLTEKMGLDFHHLNEIYAEVNGISLDQHIIISKIEATKEYLLYQDKNIKEIAALLHYSSSTTLREQFIKITGLTPVFFKQLKQRRSKLKLNRVSVLPNPLK